MQYKVINGQHGANKYMYFIYPIHLILIYFHVKSKYVFLKLLFCNIYSMLFSFNAMNLNSLFISQPKSMCNLQLIVY